MNTHSYYGEVGESVGVFFKTDEPLYNHCFYGTGGNAKAVYYPETPESLKELANQLKKRDIPFVFLGNGTNVLVSDEGYDGAVISTERLKGITISGNMLTALSGSGLAEILHSALYNSLGGMEFLCGIPATVGGAVAMNAGCFGKSIGDYVLYVVSVSGIYKRQECGFDYRTSRFLRENDGILSVCFNLENVEYDQSENKVEYFTALRRNKQPKGKSCGCVFKNDGYFAGKIIESCDLKGERVGKAFVSDKHANFIVAENGATSLDISRLIKKIKKTVSEKCGINLIEEIQYLGNFEDAP